MHGARLVRQASWEGARDVVVTDEMIHVIAAHAALLTAGFEIGTHPYLNVRSVIVHGRTIVTRGDRPGPVRGLVTSGPQYLAGQSGHGRGPVLLDWQTVARQVADPDRGVNVVYHEFAHKLDQLDGAADGMPPLPSRAEETAWTQTFGTNYRRLRRRGQRRPRSGLRRHEPRRVLRRDQRTVLHAARRTPRAASPGLPAARRLLPTGPRGPPVTADRRALPDRAGSMAPRDVRSTLGVRSRCP